MIVNLTYWSLAGFSSLRMLWSCGRCNQSSERVVVMPFISKLSQEVVLFGRINVQFFFFKYSQFQRCLFFPFLYGNKIGGQDVDEKRVFSEDLSRLLLTEPAVRIPSAMWPQSPILSPLGISHSSAHRIPGGFRANVTSVSITLGEHCFPPKQLKDVIELLSTDELK